MSDLKVPVANWLESDAQAIWRLHNFAAASVGSANLDHRTIRRRLLLLSYWLKTTAEAVYGPIEPEALGTIEAFWRARAAGSRGEDDAETDAQ